MLRPLKRLATRVIDAASWLRVGLLVLAYAACMYLLMSAEGRIKERSGGLGVPDLLHGFTADELYARLGAYGDEGRAIYLRAELVDLVYPLVYGFFFAFLIALAARRVLRDDSPWRLLCLAPLVATLFDYLENACFFTVLLRWPERLDRVAQLASIFNLGKWSCFGVALPATVLGLVALAVVALRARRATSA
ncbi:MAG: hypothetical protein ABJE95_38825 [Byssovorax sp.]